MQLQDKKCEAVVTMYNIRKRNITAAYDELCRLVWFQGNRRTDQRGNSIKELKRVAIEITTADIRYPVISPVGELFGRRFAQSLIDDTQAAKDGAEFDYAYGDRIRKPKNAIRNAIKALIKNPETRRVVLPIYRGCDVANCNDEKCEVPCATQAFLSINENMALDLTLTMRSNDIVKAFPADAYGFRCLQKHIAEQIGVGVGFYTHYAESAHIILDHDSDFMEKLVQEGFYEY